MRRAILVALARTGGGLYLSATQLFWAGLFAGLAMMGAGFMICLGGWLLWDDLVAWRIPRDGNG